MSSAGRWMIVGGRLCNFKLRVHARSTPRPRGESRYSMLGDVLRLRLLRTFTGRFLAISRRTTMTCFIAARMLGRGARCDGCRGCGGRREKWAGDEPKVAEITGDDIGKDIG